MRSESAGGRAEGRTAHQPIHRTAERFQGGGWASERGDSKKSFGNYLQLWARLGAIAPCVILWEQGVVTTLIGLKVQRGCVTGSRLWILRAQAAWWPAWRAQTAVTTQAGVKGSHSLNPDPAFGPRFEGCRTVVWKANTKYEQSIKTKTADLSFFFKS